ncbi:bifunctional diaminohydroxyphosphoribosylaminopyrimidine deaminase/5-amino-6-(5-phosphoribosylamino)uracil reductase RibD [Enterobacteriaceae bacterium ET-AT1-13]|nr:bifunctional diaminohydroxyphosphoribosylaminopyrimidine deaminase/5-amino-6-(5-phosphoribosylamino)uracil reductase RibD [Enterobacteriaceae bacterium ET-AT1-13]WGS66438.1 bifunctional diaminohydroxyphosphoribosylaminopyrimidine deaminase/5-amino-6-(5-phosphoribosylamino)uracil reductase RibD [Enterobacteriaceae bacterium Cmel17]WMC17463.1 MAG: bifunctional diaminohydroxyphosphoribosylaminopyrimidine deaminase/5-amino-6-(5-phosphoribosylamino)uracil reductase RibD [Enterobacteriaceae bacteriu
MNKNIKLNKIQLKIDKLYINRAFQLSYLGNFSSMPNPSVGCIIVKKNKIIGEGIHMFSGGPHAEINALRDTIKKVINSTIYVTLEPCIYYGLTPPCVKAIIYSGIKRVVIAVKDPNPKILGNSFKILKNAGLQVSYISINFKNKNNIGFFKRMITGLPYIKLKYGISLDGRTALLSGVSKWITSIDSRINVQKLRSQCSAILSTSNTILFDNPSFKIHLKYINKLFNNLYPFKNLRQPLIIIIDSKNKIKPKHKIIKEKREVLLIRFKKDKKKWPNNVHQIIFKKKKKINLKFLMSYLGKIKINNILVEAGSKLSGLLLKLKLIDELILYISPKILGNKSLGLFNLPNFKKILNKNDFIFKNIKKINNDLKIILKKNF